MEEKVLIFPDGTKYSGMVKRHSPWPWHFNNSDGSTYVGTFKDGLLMSRGWKLTPMEAATRGNKGAKARKRNFRDSNGMEYRGVSRRLSRLR